MPIIYYNGEYTRDNKEKGNTMETLLAISMTTTMAIVGLWLYSSFKWQGWGKI
jgi:hypothetical protein